MTKGPGGQGGALIYIGADAGLARELRAHLAGRVPFAAFEGAAPLVATIESSPGCLLVVDARGGSATADPQEVLARIEAAGVPRPSWACLVDPGDLSARLHAMRGGARACLVWGGSIEDLCRRLLALCGVAAETPYRVLVVDDQEVAALFAVRVLEKAGMQARAVTDAMTVLHALGEMRPDLVLMDLHMPGADGMELTRVIREHEQFFDLPIVFLSGECDPNRQMDTLRVGGNDFLSKPVSAGLLVDTVRRRIEAARQSLVRGAGTSARDTATGLWSRDTLLQRIDTAMAADAAAWPGSGVLYVAIDPNPALSELPGLLDVVFAEAARTFGEGLCALDPATDLVARVGPAALGLLVRRPSLEALLACAEGLRARIAGQTWTLEGAKLRLTASIGIAPFLPPADDAITMISRAKKGCSRARHAGGDRCEVYGPALPQEVGTGRSSHLVELMREALAGDGFSLSYQPVVALRRHAGESYEALLRLRTADGELISPFDFLPVAREVGLMPEIDRWVVGRALDETLRRRVEHPALQILIRQTLATVIAPGWVDWLREEIARRDLIRQRPALMFDLDEVAAHPADAEPCFVALRRLGIRLCLNRVNDAPDALSLFARLRLDLARLEQGALDKLSNARLLALVEAAHRGGAAVIATGIEHPQAIAKAWGCGVDFIEGNFVQPAGEGLDFDFAGTDLA